MEKLIRPCDKEYLKMTMLKHEDTFKEQVHELHRLYRIQKILMKNMEVNQRGWNFKNAIGLTQNGYYKGAQKNPRVNFDLERPAMEDMTESDSDDGIMEFMNETEIELTLGPSSYNRKKVETALTSDRRHGLCSSTGFSLINKTRCKTHHSSHATREELSGGMIGFVQVPHSTSGCHSGIRNSYDIEEQSRQERSKHPHLGFFQVLSLNTT
ncbi:uncharacterized protein LOC113869469 [Abrus precatorius]|uniref:Uncharacterized protein LOC113869469 n=1 Tax=Abrus precatorius TaxID=3816 RepID=A0A8B8M325_ABRPR|nr:uncharacterized protein LOC113869469 [Abrus precatorius]